MDVICFSEINWDFLWQRHQQLLTRFPEDWKILYVQPSFMGVMIKEPTRVLPRKVKNNIRVVSLLTMPFFDKFFILRKINDVLIVFWTRFFMKNYNIKNPIVIIYEPRFSCVVGKLNEFLIYYEIADDRLEFTKVPRWIKTHIDFLIQKADLVTVASQYLYNKLKEKRRHNIFLVGNGVEVEHFKKARENIEIPRDICDIKKPILGYVGTIGEWFDFQLIEAVLKKFTDISVVLIGPIFPEQRIEIYRLKKSYTNFYAFGKKSYILLPNFIRAFDACIIPFKINELTRGVNPNKLYEYLAAGKPVISTALPEVKKYDGTVYVAENYEAFLSHINKALDSTPDLEKFFKIADENTWEEKAKEIVNLIIKYGRKICG